MTSLIDSFNTNQFIRQQNLSVLQEATPSAATPSEKSKDIAKKNITPDWAKSTKGIIKTLENDIKNLNSEISNFNLTEASVEGVYTYISSVSKIVNQLYNDNVDQFNAPS